MTEAEAKTKWCHAFTASHTDPRAREWVQGKQVGGFQHACIGSGCMAWRDLPTFGAESKIDAIRRHREEHNSSLVDAKNYVEAHPNYVRAGEPVGGYCGLAGKPE